MQSNPLVGVVPKGDRCLQVVRDKAEVKRVFEATSQQSGRDLTNSKYRWMEKPLNMFTILPANGLSQPRVHSYSCPWRWFCWASQTNEEQILHWESPGLV